MGQAVSCWENQPNQPCLEEADIQGFYDALITNPVFKGRFKNVPMSRILSMANQMIMVLRCSIKKGHFEEIFLLHLLMNITEAEIDVLFKVFVKECHFEDSAFLDGYEVILESITNMMTSNRIGGHSTLKFFAELKRNPVLNHTFRTTSPLTLTTMTDEIFKIFADPNPEERLYVLAESHSKLKITQEEFDEFMKLFSQICSPDVAFYARVGPKIALIKEFMVGQTFNKVVAFKEAFRYSLIEGRTINKIPLEELKIMSAKMVHAIKNPNEATFDVIVKSHKCMKITLDEFTQFMKLVLESCSHDESFIRKARELFQRLKETMFTTRKLGVFQAVRRASVRIFKSREIQ